MISFGEFKLSWLDAVHRTSAPTAADLHVAHSLFEKFVSGVEVSFEASQADMAAEAKITRRGLQKILSRLEENNLLRTVVRKGPGRMNEFLFVLPRPVNNR